MGKLTSNSVSKYPLERSVITAVNFSQRLHHFPHSFVSQLVINVGQIFGLFLPKLDFHKRIWVLVFQQGRCRIGFEDISDLVGPIDDDTFDGMNHLAVTRKEQVRKIERPRLIHRPSRICTRHLDHLGKKFGSSLFCEDLGKNSIHDQRFFECREKR